MSCADDRWWNPAVEDQARVRAWRIGQTRTVISHRLICPGTVDERVEEVVAGKRRIAGSRVAEVELARRSRQWPAARCVLGIRPDAVLAEDLLASDEGVRA